MMHTLVELVVGKRIIIPCISVRLPLSSLPESLECSGPVRVLHPCLGFRPRTGALEAEGDGVGNMSMAR